MINKSLSEYKFLFSSANQTTNSEELGHTIGAIIYWKQSHEDVFKDMEKRGVCCNIL